MAPRRDGPSLEHGGGVGVPPVDGAWNAHDVIADPPRNHIHATRRKRQPPGALALSAYHTHSGPVYGGAAPHRIVLNRSDSPQQTCSTGVHAAWGRQRRDPTPSTNLSSTAGGEAAIHRDRLGFSALQKE